MNFEEFLVDKKENQKPVIDNPAVAETETTNDGPVESEELNVQIDVQKAVVESLAAEKVEQDEQIKQLKSAQTKLEAEVAKLRADIEKLTEQLLANQESALSTQVTLLERDETLAEKFSGEFRDQVIESLREARNQAEKVGRLRRAQILESVLVANETSGELDKRRAEVDKIFSESQYVINGTVIEELKKLGISHKKGEEYLLPSEIIKENF